MFLSFEGAGSLEGALGGSPRSLNFNGVPTVFSSDNRAGTEETSKRSPRTTGVHSSRVRSSTTGVHSSAAEVPHATPQEDSTTPQEDSISVSASLNVHLARTLSASCLEAQVTSNTTDSVTSENTMQSPAPQIQINPPASGAISPASYKPGIESSISSQDRTMNLGQNVSNARLNATKLESEQLLQTGASEVYH